MRGYFLSLIFLLIALPVTAQSTQADLDSRLLHQPLYLRGQWASNKLAFDAKGNLLGNHDGFPFTLSGVEIQSLKLSPQALNLKGSRFALIFGKNGISRQRMADLRVNIDAPANGDYGPVLDKVFTSSLADFVPALPSYWQVYGREHLLPGSVAGVAPDAKPNFKKVIGDVSAPKVLSAKPPTFPDYARRLKVEGHVLVYLQVDTAGKPGHLRIVKPLGAGLDEQAIRAVSQYKFKPAEEKGVPVPVEMAVDVAFAIF